MTAKFSRNKINILDWHTFVNNLLASILTQFCGMDLEIKPRKNRLALSWIRLFRINALCSSWHVSYCETVQAFRPSVVCTAVKKGTRPDCEMGYDKP